MGDPVTDRQIEWFISFYVKIKPCILMYLLSSLA